MWEGYGPAVDVSRTYPSGVPCWLDIEPEDAVATSERLGASVVSGPHDDEWTKHEVVRDPQGAVLTLNQFDAKS